MNHLKATPGRPMLSRRIRVIPTLLVDRDGRLVKTERFGKRTYIGDPINAVRIFNSKQVDELVLIDIDASVDGRAPDYERLSDIAAEAYMPVAYGGGVMTEEVIAKTFDCGVEKVILSSALLDGVEVIERAALRWGAQSIVVCLPCGKNWHGKHQVRFFQGNKAAKGSPEVVARQVTAAGAGEIFVYSIDRDGTWEGYDLDMLKRITAATDLPVVACGGASGLADFRLAVTEGGCAAVAAGSLFIYQAKGRGVLISYPGTAKLRADFFSQI